MQEIHASFRENRPQDINSLPEDGETPSYPKPIDRAAVVAAYLSGLSYLRVGHLFGISASRARRTVRSCGHESRKRASASYSREWSPKKLARADSRFDAAVTKVADGCWIWTKSRNSNGYGKLAVAGHTIYAHRFSYERFVGKIENDLTIDHLCRNRACVNPDHLEAVTLSENVQRAVDARAAERIAA